MEKPIGSDVKFQTKTFTTLYKMIYKHKVRTISVKTLPPITLEMYMNLISVDPYSLSSLGTLQLLEISYFNAFTDAYQTIVIE